jgi:bifunctional non-homologous end joining protein LigD
MAKDLLSEYAAKRTFTATPEPRASVAARREGPLLFVIQQHAATRLHYDFRLECDGVLKSWAVPKGPSLDPSEKRLAMQTEDHPYDYASFEGIIPKGQYGAGEVIVWDCGVYSPDEPGVDFEDREAAQARVREGLEKGKLSIQLRGEKVKGSFALVKTKEKGAWLLIKHKDRFVATADVTAKDRSPLSGATVGELKVVPAHRIPAANLVPSGKRTPLPRKLEPMLAETGDAAFNKPEWMWEPKLDGYRVLAFVDANGVQLRSRKGLELGENLPTLTQEIAKNAACAMVIDAELVAFDASGKPSFNALQNAGASTTAALVCFDLLYFGGIDLRDAPYADRRRYLAQCLMPSPHVQLVHAVDDGVALQAAALASGFEGVVGKRKDSRYEAGRRSKAWIKVKPMQSGEFAIGGYTKGKGSRALGAILVGQWDQGKLRFASHVGSGFDEATEKALLARLKALASKECPFTEKPELNGPATWTRPSTIAEVSYQGWTEDNRLRAPVFLRVRDDVRARSVVDDILAQLDDKRASMKLAVGGHAIALSNLDREYWPAHAGLKQPALTKRDLIRYLAQVGDLMLPHLADRPLTMIRMPSGIGGERFFQKHWEQARPEFVETITVFSGHKDESHEYLLCNNLPTLLWLAQSGTLEYHIWHSRAKTGPDTPIDGTDYDSSLESLEASILNYPDYVVFDIDPYIYSGKEAPGAEPELNTVAFEKGKEVAFWLREVLHGLSLEAVVKTSGKTGLHIFVPIRRTLDFDAARHVSELVGRHLVAGHPRDVTVEWSIPKRTGKIFMDYNMNVRGKTLNVAYSPRGEPGAPVSMPLTWDELAGAHPLDFRLTNAIERLAQTGDRWADVLDMKQDLEGALAASRRK